MGPSRFDIIVIGGGHAGAEAAWAAAGLGASVALVTMDPARIGVMSCNPAIGGLAKGQIVREIDALGGLMARATDATGIQFRVLNTSRGAAVHGPRAQCDKYAYSREVQRLLSTRPITIIPGTVDDLVVSHGRCLGIIMSATAERIESSAVVLTTGTFMRGLMHTGAAKTVGGRVNEAAAVGISAALTRLGFELGRLKTGTPPRLAAESVDFDSLRPQWGDAPPRPFSEMSPCGLPGAHFPTLKQVACHESATNAAIHDLIRANLHLAPMYSGQIEAECGPRYCPSIEDKVVRFSDRDSHHVFLEPESLDTNEIYCNGISTSLPREIQDQIVPQMPGCARARILRHGYAVEYDMVWPHQIDATAMTKRIDGLFLAGQINGTSGYEEAAGQGVIAGINAVRFARNAELIRLGRDTSYIGVMMDDLVTKTPREPYRMFTSRAEHRLRLRADNAPDRLTPLAHDIGVVCADRWRLFQHRRTTLHEISRAMDTVRTDGRPLRDLARREGATPDEIRRHIPGALDARLVEIVMTDLRYDAYLARQENDIRRMAEMERRSIPADLAFPDVRGLRAEAIEVMTRFRPATLGQALRLAGVNPADVSLLAVAIHTRRNSKPGAPRIRMFVSPTRE